MRCWWLPTTPYANAGISPSLCQFSSRLLCYCRVTVIKVQSQHLAPHGLVTRILPATAAAEQAVAMLSVTMSARDTVDTK
jgi:hypothetical protein